MARASKMGADVATREANRARLSGYVCTSCEQPIKQGELLMVRMVEFEQGRTRKRRQVAFHRGCYKTS
ncbi:MAG: hypothetical protein JW934_08705 [Anaerolineae bacterium]|nr:hypothetical protein [Anaerolineae bacterium]